MALERKDDAIFQASVLSEFKEAFQACEIFWNRRIEDIIKEFLKGDLATASSLSLRLLYNQKDFIFFESYIGPLQTKREIDSHSLTIQEYLLLTIYYEAAYQEDEANKILLMLEETVQGIEDPNANLLISLAFLYAFTLDNETQGKHYAEKAKTLKHPRSYGFFAHLESNINKKMELFEEGLQQGDWTCLIFLLNEFVNLIPDPKSKQKLIKYIHEGLKFGFLESCKFLASVFEEEENPDQAEIVLKFDESYNTRFAACDWNTISAYLEGKGTKKDFSKAAYLFRENGKIENALTDIANKIKNKISKEIVKAMLTSSERISSMEESMKSMGYDPWPPHPTYLDAVFHLALYYFEKNKLNEHRYLVGDLENFALTKPQEFDALCAQESWHKISSILDEKTGAIVANRRQINQAVYKPQLQTHLSFFLPARLANVVSDYLGEDVYLEKIKLANEIVAKILQKMLSDLQFVTNNIFPRNLNTLGEFHNKVYRELYSLRAKNYHEIQHLETALKLISPFNSSFNRLFRCCYARNTVKRFMIDSLKPVQQDLEKLRDLLVTPKIKAAEPGDSKSERRVDRFFYSIM